VESWDPPTLRERAPGKIPLDSLLRKPYCPSDLHSTELLLAPSHRLHIHREPLGDFFGRKESSLRRIRCLGGFALEQGQKLLSDNGDSGAGRQSLRYQAKACTMLGGHWTILGLPVMG